MGIKIINPKDGSLLYNVEGGLQDEYGNFFRLEGGAYRIVSSSGYTENFGFQWNKYQKLQIDKYNGMNLTKERFFKATGWKSGGLKGENILEVGSGAGRFTQILLDHTEANLYSVDYSAAVEANYRNNGPHQRLKLFQASIYELPFPSGAFDKVFCFGVLQHTPDVEKSVKCLIDMVRPGGEVVIDFYPINGFWTKIQAKYLLRPLTKKMKNETLYKLIVKNLDWMVALSKFFIRMGIGRFTNRFIPVCDIKKTIPKDLSDEDFRQWVILDTFDMLSPEYDQPQKIEDVKKWFLKMGMSDVFAGFIEYGKGFQAAVVKGRKLKGQS